MQLFAEAALLPQGWARNVLIAIGSGGIIGAVNAGINPPRSGAISDRGSFERAGGPLIPGMVAAHIDPLHRTITGLGQEFDPRGDGSAGYAAALAAAAKGMTPEALEALATLLFMEMLEAGWTHAVVAHGLHLQADGRPYGNPAELALRIVTAAATAGIGLTLLPVFAEENGLFPQPEDALSRRRSLRIPAYVEIYGAAAKDLHAIHGGARMGVGFAGLGALRATSLAEVVLQVTQADASAPVVLPVGGPRAELDACREATGMRPVDWLLRNAPVGPRWTAVHATQAGEGELQGMLQAGMTVATSPIAEADHGFGVFPTSAFLERGGKLALACDGAIAASPAEELAFMERVQRLSRRRRGVLGPPTDAQGRQRRGDPTSIGRHLWTLTAAGGAAPAALPVGSIAKGQRADLIVLNTDHPVLSDKTGDQLLDTFIFAHRPGMVGEVMVAGRWVVQDGAHPGRKKAESAFRKHLWKVVAVA